MLAGCTSQYNDFQNIKKGMSIDDVHKLVGKEDADIGSGISVLQYKQHDDTDFLIGIVPNSGVMYVRHRIGNNTETLVE